MLLELLKRKQRATRDGNVKQLAEVLKELGDFYFEAGRFQDALQEYLEQVEACEVTENKLECAVAHRMIGEVHASMGNYEEALVHQNQHLGTLNISYFHLYLFIFLFLLN